jgi:hypothetical protein
MRGCGCRAARTFRGRVREEGVCAHTCVCVRVHACVCVCVCSPEPSWAQALARAKTLQVNYPIRHGLIENWNNMERLWQRCIFDYLRVEPEEHHILLVRVPPVRCVGGCGLPVWGGAGRALHLWSSWLLPTPFPSYSHWCHLEASGRPANACVCVCVCVCFPCCRPPPCSLPRGGVADGTTTEHTGVCLEALYAALV